MRTLNNLRADFWDKVTINVWDKVNLNAWDMDIWRKVKLNVGDEDPVELNINYFVHDKVRRLNEHMINYMNINKSILLKMEEKWERLKRMITSKNN